MGMKVALVHSWLNQYGGAERVLEVLHQMYPDAPIYTSMFWPKAMPESYRKWDLRLSFMQRLPLVKARHQPFLALYPLAFQQFDMRDYDLIISNSSAFCHGVRSRPQTCHICYCLTPARFLWNYGEYVRRENIPGVARALLPLVLGPLRAWDRRAAQRVTHFVAISQAIADRISRFYGRQSTIIYPPVGTSLYQPLARQDNYFLIVSRLIPYKRIDLAVEAFNRLRLPLKIVGDGRDRAALQAMAKDNIEFLGRIPDSAVKEMYARCRGFVFPGEEDFGLTPLEAQASGRPVIAYAGGGALETVVEGQTGTFFDQPSAEALIEAVRRFDGMPFDAAAIRRHAESFSIPAFQENLSSYVDARYAEHRRAFVGR
ncbi:MAG: glycosyltransferase [Bacteroidetes bacterium]|nr:glycosyltransferase [Bacteroidota bacterium]